MSSKYNFEHATITQSAIGDKATVIVQGWDATQLHKLADDLSKVYPDLQKRATDEKQVEDVKTVDAIRQEAKAGNKTKVIELIKKLGAWGWATLKELGVSVAVEAATKLVA